MATTMLVPPWETPSLGMHPTDRWMAQQRDEDWHYIAPGHLVSHEARPEDDFDRLPDWDQWLAVVKDDLRKRCVVPGVGGFNP